MGFIFIFLELSSLTRTKWRDFPGGYNRAKDQYLFTGIVVLVVELTVQTVVLVLGRILAWG